MQARMCRRLAGGALAAALGAASLAGAEPAAADDGAETGGPQVTLAAADARLSAATPSLTSATKRATRSPARNLRIRKPARVVAGDVLLAAVVARVPDRSRITAPRGWRLVRSDRRSRRQKLTQVMYLKVARSSEPAVYAWSFASRVSAVGGILSYRGVDAAHPVDAHSGRSTSTARRRISAPSLISTMPGSMIVGFFGARETMPVGPPRGASKRFGAATRKGSSPASVSAADFVKPLPGATGAMVAEARALRRARNRRAGTAQAGGRIGQQVALRPAGAADLLVAAPPDVLPGLPDLLPPDTAIVGGPSGTTTATSASFAFESSEPGSVFECRLDGGAWGGCVTPTGYSGLAAGPHTFAVRAIDAAGNVDPLPATRSWTVQDTAAGETTITSAPAGRTSSTDATFEFSSAESGATFECRLDGGAWEQCSSPRSYSGLSQGSHSFGVRAADSAGNTDPTPASWTWTVDTVAPNTTIDSGPSGTSTSTTPSFGFSSSEAGSSFECNLDGASWETCTSPAAYTGLADGPRTFQVRAMDAAGNPDASPATRSWTIDATAPATTITSGPSGTVSSTSADFEFSASEGGSTFECRLDAGAWSACSSPKSYDDLGGGSHTFEVRATDAAGNTDASPASRTWTIDTGPAPDLTPPDTSISAGPSGTTASSSASFSFTASESGSTFECNLDGGGFTACSAPKAYSALADGPHTFEVRATDPAGNPDPSPASRTWTVDTTAATTDLTSGPTGTTTSGTASFGFSSPDAGATFECRLDGGSFAACTSPKAYSGLADGSHTFDVRAIDGAGNADATPASRTWSIDATAPSTTISSGPSGPTNATSASFAFSASESGSSFECRLDAGAWGACTSPEAYSSLADASYTFEVRATDAAGNTDASPATRSWTVDTVPPDTTITSGPSGTSTSHSASFEFASTQTGSTFECRLDGSSWGACSSPKAYADVTDGSHTFEVRAADQAQNTDATPASRTWIVAGAPPGPGGAGLPAPLAESTGAVFHVATTGSDAAAGSLAAPWATVQKALSTLQPGQKALVHAGTYTQALDLTRACTAAAPCTVQGAPGEARPVLRVTDDHVLRAETSAAYWRISGFVFRDSDITSGGLVDLYGHHLELSHNELTASGDQDFYLDEASHHIQLLSNWMHHSGLGRTHQSHGAYLQGDDHLVANNLIHDHPYGFGVQVYDKGLRSILVNNTITHNKHAGIVVGGSGGVSGVVVRNNILAYNEGNGLAWDGTCPNASQGTTFADHNVIFGNGSAAIDTQSCSATSTAGGNRFTDPLFADAAGRVLHLRAGSPAFGYALPEWAPATDRDGVPRPQGSGPDSGAYEDE